MELEGVLGLVVMFLELIESIELTGGEFGTSQTREVKKFIFSLRGRILAH